MRDFKNIICLCGHNPKQVSTTKEEREMYGCHYDSENFSCCVVAIECPNCKAKFTFSLEAPEWID